MSPTTRCASPEASTNLVNFRGLCAYLGMSRATAWRLKTRGFIPIAIDLGPKLSRYDANEVRRALADRAAEIRQSADDERTGFVPTRRGRPRKNPVQASTPNA